MKYYKLLLICLSGVGFSRWASADCIASVPTVDIAFPNSMVQADSPMGTTIATATASYSIRCKRESGMTPSEYTFLIHLSAANTSYGPPLLGNIAPLDPLNYSGLGIRWTNTTSNVGPSVMTTTSLNDTSKGRGIPAADGNYTTTNFTDQFELVKTGSVQNFSDSAISIPPIEMRYKSAFGNIIGANPLYKINFLPFNLTTGTCNFVRNPIEIGMGNHRIDEFSGVGSTTASMGYSIPLNCVGKTRMNVSFSSPSALPGYVGTVGLTSDSTASGIGIQLLDTSDAPFPFDQTRYIFEAPEHVIEVGLLMKVRYIQVAPTVSPGTANGTVQVTVSYL